MLKYLIRRVLQAIVMVFLVMSFVFLAGRSIGDPARLILGEQAEARTVLQLRERLGLEDPLMVQYVRFLGGVARGDFGDSYRFGLSSGMLDGNLREGTPSLPLVLERLPATFYLAGTAMVIALLVAIPLGIGAAMRPRSAFDRFVNVVSLAGVSIVEFWLALMLMLFFATYLGLLPTAGYGGVLHVILPAIALAMRPIGRITQITRSAMLDELARPYITAARSKGLSRNRVAYVHAMKNAAVPVVTISGDEAASIITGVIIIEFIFAWPGIGQLTLDALSRRDLPIVQAAVFVMVVMVVLINLFVDMLYTALNPRVSFK